MQYKKRQKKRVLEEETGQRQIDVRCNTVLGSVKQDSLSTHLAHQTGILLHFFLII